MANPSNDAVAIRAANEHPANFKKIFGVDKDTFFKAGQGAVNTVGNVGASFETLGKKVLKASQMTYSKPYANIINGISLGPSNVAGGIDKLSDSITSGLDGLSKQLQVNTEPFSEYVGSTLATLTGVLNDPLGPNGLGNVATKLINSVSPSLGEKINGLNQSLNMEALARFPKQMASGLDHIMTGIGNLLAVPLNILTNIYNGFQAILQSISKLISNITKSFTKLLMDFLDSIIPINSILGLLSSISSIAGKIGNIAGAFNIGAITNITSQITGFTDQFTSALSNPLDFASSLLPSSVGSVLTNLQNPENFIQGLLPEQLQGFVGGIQNPESLLKSLLPPDLRNGFDQIAEMTGFGYQGNAGWGFKKALDGTQGTALSNIMSNFNDKLGVVAPLLAGQPETPEGHTPQLNAGHNVSGYNEARRVNRNQYESSEKINPDGSVTRRAYGVEETTKPGSEFKDPEVARMVEASNAAARAEEARQDAIDAEFIKKNEERLAKMSPERRQQREEFLKKSQSRDGLTY